MTTIPVRIPGHRMEPVHCGSEPPAEIARFPDGERTVLVLVRRGKKRSYEVQK